jgi:hypothetical protein
MLATHREALTSPIATSVLTPSPHQAVAPTTLGNNASEESLSAPSNGATASSGASASSQNRCALAKAVTEASSGWIFLGWLNKDKTDWVPSQSGTRSVSFDTKMPVGHDIAKQLLGLCFQAQITKYLRQDGPLGHKADTPVIKPIAPLTHLRILDVDDTGFDMKTINQYPVVWARVVTLDR